MRTKTKKPATISFPLASIKPLYSSNHGKNKKIIFDSGMYDGNSRNYSQFRGSGFWNELIIEEY